MQLSVSTGSYGILQRATFLTFGDSVSHITDYPLADMIASANAWVQQVGAWIFKASGTWEYDDGNQTNLPSATTTLVDDQRDYSLPSDILEILRVEVKDSSGNWSKLSQLDQSEIPVAYTEFEKTKGMPIYYDIRANSIFLLPAPATASVTLASGLRIYFSRENKTFSVPASYTIADTTEPGFDEPFHDIVCLGIAYDYLSGNDDEEKANKIFQRIMLKKADLDTHYGKKNKDKKVAFKPRRENYR